MVHIIESQLNYVIDYLRTLKRRGVAALDVRAEAQDRWCAEVERRMASTVWATGGCVSWYLNAAGRNPTLWPASTLRFRRETRRIDLDEYTLIAYALHPTHLTHPHSADPPPTPPHSVHPHGAP
jgi:hypothetical protein